MDRTIPLKILVTGANGQLGRCLLDVSKIFPQFEYHFKTSKDLDITDFDAVKLLFDTNKFQYCINCAAYTSVDRAESEMERAFLINAESVRNLAEVSLRNNTTLLHISTDFVFDGTKKTPYTEEDEPNPLNVYGASKLKGEQYIQEILNNYFIIRTSWVYSKYGQNFVKTMLRLAKERDEINVVNNQIGSPTYAGDLAEFLVYLIQNHKKQFGIYNYSNEGAVSWYEFASKIFAANKVKIKVSPITTEEYHTPAKRPMYSVLDKNKTKQVFNTIIIPNLENSLKEALYNTL